MLIFLSLKLICVKNHRRIITIITFIRGTIKPTAVVKVPVTETLKVTDKTHVQEPVVDTGVLDHHGPLIHVDSPLIHVDPDTVKDVAIAGAATGVAVAGGVALGTLFAELLPMLPLFAFGKRDVTEQTRDFEDFVNTVMKAQDFD